MTFLIIAVIALVIQTIWSVKYCDIGGMGYPDRWETPAAEAVYNILCIVEIVMMAAGIITILVEY